MVPDPSKPVPLEAEAVEAAAKAIENRLAEEGMGDPAVFAEEAAQAAIHAADEARGMRVETRQTWTGMRNPPADPEQRLVSNWKPIKGPVDE